MSPTHSFHQFLGIHVTAEHEDGVLLELPWRDELLNSSGELHGGVAATLVDAALGVAIQRRYAGRKRATTVEFKINYLRPACRGALSVRSRFVKTGRTLVIGEADVFDSEQRHIARALLTYMLLPLGEGPTAESDRS